MKQEVVVVRNVKLRLILDLGCWILTSFYRDWMLVRYRYRSEIRKSARRKAGESGIETRDSRLDSFIDSPPHSIGCTFIQRQMSPHFPIPSGSFPSQFIFSS